ncbi:MAG: GNAT family N-acetyltransferase [Clostridia bacterium]|nr:GNAT family N-acetyltransferase [Clostridia bacterium]
MIRRAEQKDAAVIGRIYCEGWMKGYDGLMPDFFLNALTPENCAPKPDHIAPDRRFVAEVDGEVVGTVTFGKGREDSALLEIQSLYVLPDRWQKGQGSALFRAVVDTAKAQRYPGLYVWTLEDNTRAKAFYEHMGMTPTGAAREFEIAGAYLPEVKYQLKW